MHRPERYVPLSVRFATGKTGTALQERFGRDGLVVWAAFLAACKLNRPEGEIAYASEEEGWRLLGLIDPPAFTLADFFAFTGKLKKTRRTRSGRVSYVVCTPWGRWTKTQKQEDARQRKSSSRAHFDRDNPVTTPVTRKGQERDLESESEEESEEPSDRSGSTPRPGLNGHHPNTPLEHLLAWAHRDIDDGGRTIKAAARGLPEVATAKVLEAVQHKRPKNRAAYVVESLKAERAEIAEVKRQARASLEYPDEPDIT